MVASTAANWSSVDRLYTDGEPDVLTRLRGLDLRAARRSPFA